MVIQPNIQERYNYIWLWIGANTTGKTPTAIQLATAIKRENPLKKVICFDPRGSIAKVKTINPKTGREEFLVDRVIQEWEIDFWWELLGTDKDGKPIGQPLKHYVLLLDDYHVLCKNYRMPEGFKKMIAMRKEHNVDIIGITHTPKYILEGLADNVTDYSIFFNLARSASFQDKIANYEKCQGGAIVINEYVSKFGFGTYPVFPFVHINKFGKVKYINMPDERLNQLKCFKYYKAVL